MQRDKGYISQSRARAGAAFCVCVRARVRVLLGWGLASKQASRLLSWEHLAVDLVGEGGCCCCSRAPELLGEKGSCSSVKLRPLQKLNIKKGLS
ncbi:Hypothetical predicted protein [Podarcis lilfordi]|uniref:Uncharacterized protein n=1 Tax=Podarcis lilfordi TaxID=74358 RepID=A0AA35PFG8_9SAUR|nr:Hypothetical predicted protein [Podarcis lilfordi]